MYLQYFSWPEMEINLDNIGAGNIWEDVIADLGDMGVEDMKTKTMDELCTLLDFQNGRPINWNHFQSQGNIQNP